MPGFHGYGVILPGNRPALLPMDGLVVRSAPLRLVVNDERRGIE